MKKLIVVSAACGVGKTTLVQYLKDKHKRSDYVYLDCDDLSLNWHSYKDLPDGGIKYTEDYLKAAVEVSKEKNIVIASCMNPKTYKELQKIEEITETHFINIVCSNEELRKRLKGRPIERMTHTDEFIETQIEYMNWLKNNKSLMDHVVDSTDKTISQTATEVRDYIVSI